MKYCRQCKQEKPFSEFRQRPNPNRIVYRSWCLPCENAYGKIQQRKRRAEKGAEIREYMRQRSADNRAWVTEKKESSPCMDCGEFHKGCVMQYDHKPQYIKTRDVSKMVSFSRERIQEEIDKCDLVCANCHAYRTDDKS